MAVPIQHHLAGGIHPATFVGVSAPVLTDEQDHVLWIDTSTGPPYQLNMWDQTSATWQPVGAVAGMDAYGDLTNDCLFFPNGAQICNDAPNLLNYSVVGGVHTMDALGYTLPGGHRLERVSV